MAISGAEASHVDTVRAVHGEIVVLRGKSGAAI
jgi:hypothetical protein